MKRPRGDRQNPETAKSLREAATAAEAILPCAVETLQAKHSLRLGLSAGSNIIVGPIQS